MRVSVVGGSPVISAGSGVPSRWLKLLLVLGPVITALVLWQIAASAAMSPFFPAPLRIVVRMWELWFSGPFTALFTTEAFWADVVPSLGRALLGWLLACVLGILIGTAAGQWRSAQAAIDPPVHWLRSLPAPAIVPIFLVVFGATDAMRLAFIVFGCVWPVLLNTMQGVRAIDPVYRETVRAFHISRLRAFFRVTLPAAAAETVAGMRVSLSLALILMVLSEWLLANAGLGFFLLDSQRQFKILDMWAAMVLLGVLGYLLNLLLAAAERRLLRWHRATTQRG